MKVKEQVNSEIKKECIERLDEVYSVIMTFGKNENDADRKEVFSYLDKIDDIQNYLEEIL